MLEGSLLFGGRFGTLQAGFGQQEQSLARVVHCLLWIPQLMFTQLGKRLISIDRVISTGKHGFAKLVGCLVLPQPFGADGHGFE